MTRKTETIEHLDASIARWKTRLKRAVTMIDKLEKKRKRLAAKPVKTEKVVVFEPEPMVKVTSHPVANPNNVKLTFEPVKDANLDIPEFLRRGQAAQKAADAVIADQIKAEQAATKTAKARGRIATMKAKKAGETKKMPLTGKAALDAIRNG
jgi:hypothetical protein